MIVGKTTRVANKGGTPAARPTHRSGNPAHMLTLGFINSRKRRAETVPAKAKKKSKGAGAYHHHRPTASTSRNVTHHKGKRNATRVVVIGRPQENRKRPTKRNPTFFGQNITAMKMAEYVAGGLIGVAVNKAALPYLPAALTSSNVAATVSSVILAAVEWWLGTFVSKDFGAAVGFGALMQ